MPAAAIQPLDTPLPMLRSSLAALATFALVACSSPTAPAPTPHDLYDALNSGWRIVSGDNHCPRFSEFTMTAGTGEGYSNTSECPTSDMPGASAMTPVSYTRGGDTLYVAMHFTTGTAYSWIAWAPDGRLLWHYLSGRDQAPQVAEYLLKPATWHPN